MDAAAETPTQPSAEALRKKANSRRASKACLKCRRRKVRCDVTRTGGPCTNCRLDSAHCEVVSRAPRKFECELLPTARTLLPAPEVPPVATSPHDNDERMTVDTSDARQRNDGLSPELYDDFTNSPSDIVLDPSVLNLDPIMEEVHYASSSSSGSHGFQMLDFGGDMDLLLTETSECKASIDPGWSSISTTCNGGMVEDRVFLEFRGCFTVPSQPALDEFIDQYYLHVHPLLPVLGRDLDFGSLLKGPDDRATMRQDLRQSGCVSALLLQAVLFAASPYVSAETIASLGYADLGVAKQSFYERAKLLYDFDVELDHVTVAQAALLLTYWFPNPNSSGKQAANTIWLRVAIEHARAAGADQASRARKVDGKHDGLRRLWWCCIVRDRIMSLCIRRSIHITDDTFDYRTYPLLEPSELLNDIGASKVHDAVSRQALATIFVLLAMLSVAMTDACSLMHPHYDPQVLPSGSSPDELLTRCRKTKSVLYKWSHRAGEKLGGILNTAEAGGLAGSDSVKHVILQANVLWMYYHATIIALDNYELQLATRASINRPLATTTVRELCGSATSIVKSLQRLRDLGVSDRVPNSSVGCSALPFALHVMCVKHYQSLHRESRGRFARALRVSEDRLATLMESMKESNGRYEGVEWISEVTLSALPGLNTAAASDPQRDSWGAEARTSEKFGAPTDPLDVSGEESIDYLADLITQNPLAYVRLSMTLDLGLRLDRMPQPNDFPENLQQRLFPGKESTYNSPPEVPFFTVPEYPPMLGSLSARDHLINSWVENDRSLFYLHELGFAP